MAKAKSDGSGKTTVPASDVDLLLRQATGLPSSFFITMTKAKVLADGSLEASYTYSTEGAPPPPAVAREESQPAEETPHGDV